MFHGNGNGGFAGSLSAGYAGMEAGLRRGYASATTDMGTAPSTALNGDPLIGHPQKWKDWGMLSTHVMTVTGKAIAKAFYGEDAKQSYYTGCSTGGQQGLIEAQYYPEDYSRHPGGRAGDQPDLGACPGGVGLFVGQSSAWPQIVRRQAGAAAQSCACRPAAPRAMAFPPILSSAIHWPANSIPPC